LFGFIIENIIEAHFCNPSYWRGRDRADEDSSVGKKLLKWLSQLKALDMMVHTHNSTYTRGITKRILVEVLPG
jgi:hypothetical protein